MLQLACTSRETDFDGNALTTTTSLLVVSVAKQRLDAPLPFEDPHDEDSDRQRDRPLGRRRCRRCPMVPVVSVRRSCCSWWSVRACAACSKQLYLSSLADSATLLFFVKPAAMSQSNDCSEPASYNDCSDDARCVVDISTKCRSAHAAAMLDEAMQHVARMRHVLWGLSAIMVFLVIGR